MGQRAEHLSDAASNRSDKQAAGAADAPGIDYLVIGHITVDTLAGHGRSLGGGSLYAAITARQLGARVALLTSAAAEPGLSEALSGIRVNRVAARQSTSLTIRYDEHGQRSQTLTGMAERLSLAQAPSDWRHAGLIHLAPECNEIDVSLIHEIPHAFLGITAQGWMRSWDEHGIIRQGDWPGAESILERANAVVVSEEDVIDPGILRNWARRTAILAVTRGERGCDIYQSGVAEPYHSPAFAPARVVDPTGAGDVFAASYFWGLRCHKNPQEAADWANCVASFVVEGYGISSIPALEAVEKRWIEGARLTRRSS